MRKEDFGYLTITDILETINKEYGTAPALQIKEKDGNYRRVSYIDLGKRAVDISSTLIKFGMEKNDKIAILSESRPEWAMAFFSVVSCAGIVVPIDVKLSEKEIQFILNDSKSKFIFVSEKYIHLIDSLKPVLPFLEHIILLDDIERDDIHKLKDLKMRKGDRKYNPITRDDTVLIVYTSGTSGVAKGVELSYRNLLFQVMAISEVVHYNEKDQFLSILPLNHMLEITGGLIAPLYTGACVTYSDSLKAPSLLSIMKETHTTTMICVPLVLKMLHDGIMKKVGKMSIIKQKMFYMLLGISKLLLKFNIRIGRYIFRSVHKEFGGRLRCFVSGGAPLSLNVEVNFNALGFRILQGYGLTETAPVISVNTFSHNRFGSVGRPLPKVEVKIAKANPEAQDGEILTRGPNVMKGYYNNPEKTKEVIKNGWLYTGDIGYLDRRGFLHISGRVRNLIVLGASKKVFPEEVEEVIGKSPYIKEICVLGKIATKGMRKGTEEVFAVVVPDLELFDGNEQENKKIIRDKISSEISRLSNNLADYKKIVDFEIWNEELPKTATRKIKRKVMQDLIAGKTKN